MFKLFTYCSKKTSVFFHGSTATKESNNGNNCSNTYDENGACKVLHRWKINIITNLQVDIDSHTEQPNTTKLKREKENFCSIKLAHTWKFELLRKLWFQASVLLESHQEKYHNTKWNNISSSSVIKREDLKNSYYCANVSKNNNNNNNNDLAKLFSTNNYQI